MSGRTAIYTIAVDLDAQDDRDADWITEQHADLIAKRLAHLPHTLTDPEVTFQEINVSAVLDRSL